MPTPPAASSVFLPHLRPPPLGCPPCSPPQSGPRFSKGHQTPGSWGPSSAGGEECLIPSPGPPAFPASAFSSLPLRHPASLFPLGSKRGLPFTRCPPVPTSCKTRVRCHEPDPHVDPANAQATPSVRGAPCASHSLPTPHLSLAPLPRVIISQNACKWHVEFQSP